LPAESSGDWITGVTMRSGPLPSGAAGGSVLVTWPGFEVARPATGARLCAAGLGIRMAPKVDHRTPGQLLGLLDGVVAAIVSTDPFDARVLHASPRLRVIARVGVGLDSIDLEAATAAGVAVCTTPGANAATTADHAVALMLAALRRLPEHDRAVRAGEWPRGSGALAWELCGATVGLVGFGTIGRLVARRLRGFGVTLLVTDPADRDVAPGTRVPLDVLLAESDVVSLHAPLTPETALMIDAKRLATMRPTAVLVNTSRGGLVDEEALLAALRAGRLRAAALDVFEREPPAAERLRSIPNLVLTPHLAGVSERSEAEMTERAVDAVLAVLAGRAPDGLVNASVLRPAGSVA
jgi:phosphoglycerate dehydrogenase-like enzyme